jgi:enoyl-CoA hydratase
VSYSVILVDDPAPMVRRVTLNRPEKRNALNSALRHEVVDALREAARDPGVRVSIVRGAGSCFSAGYDLGGDRGDAAPAGDWSTEGDGQFQRQVIASWTGIWDLAKPVIAQVHGYCLAGGSELAAGCDVVYVADDAQIGYPAVRFAVPDMQYHVWLAGLRKGMELMLTGDSMSGVDAVACGYATRSFPAADLDERVVEMATRMAQIPTDLAQINKRSVHQAMEIMGIREAFRAGIPLTLQSTRTETFRNFMADLAGGLSQAFKKRDAPFRDRPADDA